MRARSLAILKQLRPLGGRVNRVCPALGASKARPSTSLRPAVAGRPFSSSPTPRQQPSSDDSVSGGEAAERAADALWEDLVGASPFFVVAGPCAAESADLCLEVADHVSRACAALGLPFVFKASFDKANRKSHHSARGPGLEQGLENLRAVARTGIRVTTDIHEAWQAAPAAEVVDIVQIPALLCRQTDLLLAAADTGKIVNVKRGPFADVATMRHAVDKVRSVGNGKVIVTERGTACGPGQLVSDPRSLVALRSTGALVVQDVTHAAQASEQGSAVTGGRWEDGWTIARAAAAVGARGLFIETHPTPDTAASDGAVMVPLQHMQQLLEEAAAIARASRAAPAHRRDE